MTSNKLFYAINNKEYNVGGVELKVIDQNSKVYLKVEE
nr:MAG TPA: hypothetical protein [Caudoviricetes sp.]